MNLIGEVTKEHLEIVTGKVINDFNLTQLEKITVKDLICVTEDLLMNEYFNDIEFAKLVSGTEFMYQEEITYNVTLLQDRNFLIDFFVEADKEQYTVEELLKLGIKGYDNMTTEELTERYLSYHG